MIKNIINKLIYGYKATSESYIKYLKNNNVKVGENVRIFMPKQTNIDVLNPHLLEIGDNVCLTGPVTILTHDYSTHVLNLCYQNLLGKQKKVKIGNNVFLGYGCTILCGTTIGNNCIIGANSVVSGKVEDNSVYAGNPARKIMSLECYLEKIVNNQLNEAVDIYKRYKERFKIVPSIEIFHEYFLLFIQDYEEANKLFKNKLIEERITEDIFAQYILKNKKRFDNYSLFCDYCEEQIKK